MFLEKIGGGCDCRTRTWPIGPSSLRRHQDLYQEEDEGHGVHQVDLRLVSGVLPLVPP